MFTLSVDRGRNVLLVEFSGTMTDADLSGAEAAVLALVAREGPFRRIMDLTAVETLDVPQEAFIARAIGRPVTSASTLTRIHVAPTDFLYGLCRMFVTYQVSTGAIPSTIVRSRALAFEALGLTDPDFTPL